MSLGESVITGILIAHFSDTPLEFLINLCAVVLAIVVCKVFIKE